LFATQCGAKVCNTICMLCAIFFLPLIAVFGAPIFPLLVWVLLLLVNGWMMQAQACTLNKFFLSLLSLPLPPSFDFLLPASFAYILLATVFCVYICPVFCPTHLLALLFFLLYKVPIVFMLKQSCLAVRGSIEICVFQFI